MTELYNTESPIDRKRRNNINATWDDILNRFANLQRQINILAGGQEVDELIARLEQAIKAAEIDVQNYIIQVDESVQQAINKNNNALQTALQTVSETLDELNIAISKAEMATADATNAKNATIQATQDARDAINTMQSLIDNFGSRGTWSNTTQYYKNNLVEVDGRTYIALKENINTPATNKNVWALFADKGVQGADGPRGLPGKDGKDGTGVNIITSLKSEDDLPPTGSAGDAYMIDGDLYVWQDDTGSWKNVGPIQGPEGKSAYDLAVENGFEGTVEEWIESLKGETGPEGPEGPQGPPGQDADLTEVTEQLEQMKAKVDNSWQKEVYNNSGIINLGSKKATRAFSVNQADWKNTGNTEQLGIVLPFKGAFSGVIKVTYSAMWGEAGTWGSTEVVYNIGSFINNDKLNEFTITTASTEMLRGFRIMRPFIDTSTGDIALLVFRAPDANCPLQITVTVDGTFSSSKYSTIFDVLKASFIDISDLGSPTAGGYPWTPQRSQIPTASEIAFWNVSMWDDITNGRGFPINGVPTDLGTLKPAPFRDFLNSILPRRTGTFKCFVDTGHVGVTISAIAYGILTTIKPWVDESGGGLTQLYETHDLILKRYQINDTTWSAWSVIQHKDVDILNLFQSVSNGKAQVASAITGKGVQTASDATFETMANNIRAIPTGSRTQSGSMQIPAFSGSQTVSVNVYLPFVAKNALNNMGGFVLLNGYPYGGMGVAGPYTRNITVAGTTLTFTFAMGGGTSSFAGGTGTYFASE